MNVETIWVGSNAGLKKPKESVKENQHGPPENVNGHAVIAVSTISVIIHSFIISLNTLETK